MRLWKLSDVQFESSLQDLFVIYLQFIFDILFNLQHKFSSCFSKVSLTSAKFQQWQLSLVCSFNLHANKDPSHSQTLNKQSWKQYLRFLSNLCSLWLELICLLASVYEDFLCELSRYSNLEIPTGRRHVKWDMFSRIVEGFKTTLSLRTFSRYRAQIRRRWTSDWEL